MKNQGIEFISPGRMQVYSLGPEKKVDSDEIKIKTLFSGISNGTERHALLGEFFYHDRFPVRIGYQRVGRIEAVGGNVKKYRVGDIVFCGLKLGHRAWTVINTSMSDPYDINSHLCVVLPEDANYEQCALLGVASVAFRSVSRFRIKAGDNVWICGAGLVGQLTGQIAKAFGADVTITDPDDFRLKIALESGLQKAINTTDSIYINDLVQQGLFDCIITTAGLNPIFNLIGKYKLLKHNGVIGLLGTQGEVVFDWRILAIHEASLEVSNHFSIHDIQMALSLIESGQVHLTPLITHKIPIANAIEIYSILRDHPLQMLGTIFRW